MTNAGVDALLKRPLWDEVWQRRTHRVSQGASVPAGTMSFPPAGVATCEPRPLSELEEAVLIAVTGCTGLTMPDRPFQEPGTGRPVIAKPDTWTMAGRTAGSPDNAQGTHFFLINDSGTYFLQHLPPPEDGAELTPDTLVERALQAKVKLREQRLDVPTGKRDFPAYTDSNRVLSNIPGTTILFPVVDLSKQYINGLMYLLTEPDGARPAIRDDRNWYRYAGVARWVKQGYLNKAIPVTLDVLGSLRTQIEADLLLQTLFLTADAMGLGAWIHGAIAPPVILGSPKFVGEYGKMLGFDYQQPSWRPRDLLGWHTLPLPQFRDLRANPIGLRHNGKHLIKGMCVHEGYYDTMADAVDEVVAGKFGAHGIYRDSALFSRIYKGDYGNTYLTEAADYDPRIIEAAKDICSYIHETHGRFPAHCDAIHVPGVWLQVHHVDIAYYERFFRNGLTEEHRLHGRWHE